MKSDHTEDRLRVVLRVAWLLLAIPCLGLCVLAAAEAEPGTPGTSLQSLPEPVVDPHSTEICLNSRISYHGGWSATATEQMLADVLHATAQAPVTGAPLTIYAATPDHVYIYDADSHSLVVHKPGDWRSDGSAAFEVGIAAENTLDAGAAMHLAQLESVALWTGTASQLASCPKASATTYANSNWNPADPIDIVICFGIRSVPGLTDELVAISSDASLPNPRTDGAVFMDNALMQLAYGTSFAADDLGLDDVSQLLWASYGCGDHWVSGSKAGLVCASAVANYYLTRRIYSVGADGAYRFHNRLPPGGDLTTRDHRIELITSGDLRPALRSAVSDLPSAPHYLIVCVGETGSWPELEVGFAAMGAVLEATTMGLQAYLTAGLSAGEQEGIREAAGIPPADLPIAVVSLGPPGGGAGIEQSQGREEDLGLSISHRITSGGGVTVYYRLPISGDVDLAIYDCLGREVRQLTEGAQGEGSHSAVWDCCNDRGQPVRSGVYVCSLKAGSITQRMRVTVVR